MIIPNVLGGVVWWIAVAVFAISLPSAFWLHRLEITRSIPWRKNTQWNAHQTARHIAFASRWSRNKTAETYPMALVAIGNELTEKFAALPFSVATAKMSDSSGDNNVRTEIPPNEWARAELPLNLMLEEIGDGASFFSTNFNKNIKFYSDVKFDRDVIKYIWPTYFAWRDRPNAFLLLSFKEKNISNEILKSHQSEWWARNMDIFSG